MKFLTSLFPLLKFRVEENSMSPFLNSGDLVIIFRTKNVKKKDVVVFEKDEDFYIKRVIKVKPSFASSFVKTSKDKKASEGAEFFVEGDNKKESTDSRRFGWVDRKNIVGKVVYKI